MSEYRKSEESQRSSNSKILSHGRGGAGNMGYDPKDDVKPDLVTPTIKGDHFTTGRGGTGNMAKNDPAHPEFARMAQDVSEPPPRLSESDYHVGRGGGGNVKKQTAEEIIAAREQNARWAATGKDNEPVDHSKIDYRGWADKGKDKLFGRLKK